MTKPRAVTAEEYERLRAILQELPARTPLRIIAAKWGRNPVTTKVYIDRLRANMDFGYSAPKVIAAKGIMGEIFRQLDALGLTCEEQAQRAGFSRYAVTRWRHGGPIGLATAQCFAQMAGKRIVLEEQSDDQ